MQLRPARRGGAGPARRGGAGRTRGSCPARRVADMAGSRVPRQLFLQGVAAVFMFAFASLYTQIPGEGAESRVPSGGTPPQPGSCDPLISPPDTPLCRGGEIQAWMHGVEGCGLCPAIRGGVGRGQACRGHFQHGSGF